MYFLKNRSLIFQTVAGECRNLQELSLSGIKQINADVVNDIGLGCKNLLYLNIAKCYFDDGVLRVLARYCLFRDFTDLF